MNCEQLRKSLRKGKPFELGTDSQRRHALNLAKAMGALITTRKMLQGGYAVIFLDYQTGNCKPDSTSRINKKAKRNGN